jgi:aminoglycoside phosphotransferase (APT) family kinase protein
LRTLAPAPIGRGSYGGYSYFVESCLTGSTRPDTRGGWSTAAADYITALHGATQRRDSMNGDTIGRLVQAPIACVEQACGTADATQVLRQVERACTAMLRDRTMPLVLAHGDYTESNCLFDPDGRLSGVVDWEVSAQDALPFLDLLQLMPVPGEVSTAPRWQRFDAWMQLIERPQQVSADPVMARYVQALDVPAPAIPALILLQWITHLADRIEARRDDERWMRLRVWQPLESVGAFLPN